MTESKPEIKKPETRSENHINAANGMVFGDLIATIPVRFGAKVLLGVEIDSVGSGCIAKERGSEKMGLPFKKGDRVLVLKKDCIQIDVSPTLKNKIPGPLFFEAEKIIGTLDES